MLQSAKRFVIVKRKVFEKTSECDTVAIQSAAPACYGVTQKCGDTPLAFLSVNYGYAKKYQTQEMSISNTKRYFCVYNLTLPPSTKLAILGA